MQYRKNNNWDMINFISGIQQSKQSLISLIQHETKLDKNYIEIIDVNINVTTTLSSDYVYHYTIFYSIKRK